jgi:hypothetical protein
VVRSSRQTYRAKHERFKTTNNSSLVGQHIPEAVAGTPGGIIAATVSVSS